ncbi:MAG: hypothetical protein KBA79_01675 [Candidatus Cloacimonetes bacterium]|mgnify:CR=1 FL=1|nr:hypothetical protein [Candidatus Cloacimonadota bacterium]HNZ06762.1 hypothetical protein [Candidatus Cloacimonadota bacterium]
MSYTLPGMNDRLSNPNSSFLDQVPLSVDGHLPGQISLINGGRYRFYLLSLLAICVAMLALSGCGLKRKNPLDPNANPTIIVPEIISNLQVFPSAPGAASKYVDLTWQANPEYSTDGYYVYRGLGFYSAFAVVDTVYTNRASHGSKPWHSVVPGEYYYKISAFKQYSGGRLEGRPCLPVWVRIPI